MNIKEQLNNIKNLNKQLEEVVKLQNQMYAELDEQTYEKVKQHQIDANKMLREFQKGNFQAVNDLVTKYTDNANNSRK